MVKLRFHPNLERMSLNQKVTQQKWTKQVHRVFLNFEWLMLI
jgi:hypothetical protein